MEWGRPQTVRTALASAPAVRAPRVDFAAAAWNVLPPGESGDLRFPPSRYFKPERFGVSGKVVRVDRGRPFANRYCGGGDLAQCRASLWAALEAAGRELAAAQGPDPAAWRSDARPERLTFGFLPKTAR